MLTGTGNIFLGYNTTYANTFLTNAVGIGNSINLSQSNAIILGNPSGNINVGIGTATPSAKLEVVGKIKIVDGTQGSGEVLMSDAAGLASWQPLGYPCSPTGTGTFNYCYGASSLQLNTA